MPYDRSDPSTKPVIDAVNDAVSALTDLVRSLRATAKAVKKPRGGAARKNAKGHLRTRLEHAWEIFSQGGGTGSNGRAGGDDAGEDGARGGRTQRRAGGGRAVRGRASGRGGRSQE